VIHKTMVAGCAALSLGLLAACGSDSKISSAPASTVAATGALVTTAAPMTTAAPITAAPITKPAPTIAPPPMTQESPTATATATTQPGVVVVSVTVGKDSSPDRVEHVALGATVTLELTDPNAEQEYHLHGYDLGQGTNVPAGTTSRITFTADQAGTFPVESHKTEDVLVQLEVS
jgi:hypothetical protein